MYFVPTSPNASTHADIKLFYSYFRVLCVIRMYVYTCIYIYICNLSYMQHTCTTSLHPEPDARPSPS